MPASLAETPRKPLISNRNSHLYPSQFVSSSHISSPGGSGGHLYQPVIELEPGRVLGTLTFPWTEGRKNDCQPEVGLGPCVRRCSQDLAATGLTSPKQKSWGQGQSQQQADCHPSCMSSCVLPPDSTLWPCVAGTCAWSPASSPAPRQALQCEMGTLTAATDGVWEGLYAHTLMFGGIWSVCVWACVRVLYVHLQGVRA